MRGSPINAAPEHRPIPATPPAKPRPEPSLPVRASTSRFVKPKVLMGEAVMPQIASPRGPDIARQREAFRAFMLRAQLQPSAWARAAHVPANEILAFLTSKIRSLTPDTAARLARTAKVAPDDMFR
jgi:hypothetical protein